MPFESHQRIGAGYTVRFFSGPANRRSDFFMAEAAIAADHPEILPVVLVRRIEDNEIVSITDCRRQRARISHNVRIYLGPDIDKRRALVRFIEPDAAVACG